MKLVIKVEKGNVIIDDKLMSWKKPITIEGEIDEMPKVTEKSMVVTVGKRNAVEVVGHD